MAARSACSCTAFTLSGCDQPRRLAQLRTCEVLCPVLNQPHTAMRDLSGVRKFKVVQVVFPYVKSLDLRRCTLTPQEVHNFEGQTWLSGISLSFLSCVRLGLTVSEICALAEAFMVGVDCLQQPVHRVLLCRCYLPHVRAVAIKGLCSAYSESSFALVPLSVSSSCRTVACIFASWQKHARNSCFPSLPWQSHCTCHISAQAVAPHIRLQIELGASWLTDIDGPDSMSDADLHALAALPHNVQVAQLTLPHTFWPQKVGYA